MGLLRWRRVQSIFQASLNRVRDIWNTGLLCCLLVSDIGVTSCLTVTASNITTSSPSQVHMQNIQAMSELDSADSSVEGSHAVFLTSHISSNLSISSFSSMIVPPDQQSCREGRIVAVVNGELFVGLVYSESLPFISFKAELSTT